MSRVTFEWSAFGDVSLGRTSTCAGADLVPVFASVWYNETFPLGGVAVTLDKDIGLAETTVYSNAHGRVLLWDAKCGSRPYTVTATNSLGRQVIVAGDT